jgi:hypothetical protein
LVLRKEFGEKIIILNKGNPATHQCAAGSPALIIYFYPKEEKNFFTGSCK